MENPKILVFTVPSWNSKVGANSWASLLENYDSSCIANICIRDEIPDSDICSRYFNISENKILKSLFNRKIKTGIEIEKKSEENTLENNSPDLEEHNLRYRKYGKKRNTLLLLARELIWKFGHWKTKELNDFLDSFAPDIILHSMEGYIHFNRIISYSVKRTGAKAIGYLWDDNFTYKASKNFGFYIYRFFQRISLKRLASITDGFFAITEKTKKEADEFFGIDSVLLTKPLNSLPNAVYKYEKKPIRMLYTGNLMYGRIESLIVLANALKRFKDSFIIDVYTNSFITQDEAEELSDSGCFIHNAIPQDEVLIKQKECDLLLYLEAMDGPKASIARLSFSTKITDYLSSGRPILAIGNPDTAPMEYFASTKSAFVASTAKEIVEKLQNIADNPDLLDIAAKQAAFIGMKNHDPKNIQQIFDDTVKSVIMKK